MKNITQKHGYGCGVACVATILGCAYDTALGKFRNPGNARSKGYTCREIVAALSRGGRGYGYCYLKPAQKHRMKNIGTIVYVAKSKRWPAGHYLVKTEKGWMNPWINFPLIAPARSGFQSRLPGRAVYAIFPVMNPSS